jgi:hypothetical protein
VPVSQVVALTIKAHNRDQAEYVVRSRAQQRGIEVLAVEIDEAGPDAWYVNLTIGDADAARLAAAALDEDTQVLHLRGHPSRRRPE